eukprot:13475151-Ditylum_brightwellii.AAC.1
MPGFPHDVFMEIPVGMTVQNGSLKDCVLRLNESIYGLKQNSVNCFKLLSGALKRLVEISSHHKWTLVCLSKMC